MVLEITRGPLCSWVSMKAPAYAVVRKQTWVDLSLLERAASGSTFDRHSLMNLDEPH